MRPEKALLLILALTTVFFAVMLLVFSNWTDALIVLGFGALACRFLPARVAANRERDKR